jgi:hypothetical protein
MKPFILKSILSVVLLSCAFSYAIFLNFTIFIALGLLLYLNQNYQHGLKITYLALLFANFISLFWITPVTSHTQYGLLVLILSSLQFIPYVTAKVIKNYLTHSKLFGNIQKDRIEAIIVSAEFQQKWKVQIDTVDSCKDCQYRFCCIHNSDIDITNSMIRKKDKCIFNPKVNKWY